MSLDNNNLIKDHMHCPECNIQLSIKLYSGQNHPDNETSITTFYCPVCQGKLNMARAWIIKNNLCQAKYIPGISGDRLEE